jgi:hypothetical protein
MVHSIQFSILVVGTESGKEEDRRTAEGPSAQDVTMICIALPDEDHRFASYDL